MAALSAFTRVLQRAMAQCGRSRHAVTNPDFASLHPGYGVPSVSTTNPDKALVLFSGGQTRRYASPGRSSVSHRPKTIGSIMASAIASELVARGRVREGMARLRPQWGARLGDDHVVRLDAARRHIGHRPHA